MKEEQQWQAENDAYTLEQYQAIIADKKRFNKARKVAESKAKELSQRAANMKKAASKSKKNG